MIRDQAYYADWCRLNRKMQAAGFTWGSLPENGEDHQYLLYDLYRLDKAQFERILEATRKIGGILEKTARFLRSAPGLFGEMHLPPATWAAAQTPSDLFSYICRFDLAVSGDEIRLLEANADTPTGEMEASVANRLACEHFGVRSPNRLEDAIRRAFRRAQEEYRIDNGETVYFTSFGWHEEDRRTTELIRHLSGLPLTAYIPLDQLRVDQTGLYTAAGHPIRHLFRLYPLEYAALDRGAHGEPIGDLFLRHVADGKVRLINPPGAFLIQAKSTLAVIWALHEERHPLFTPEEHSAIEAHFLPTYTDNVFGEEPHVEKPILGREGGGVRICSGGQVEEDLTPYYAAQPKIYQRYFELPEVTVKTWEGEYRGKLLVGSFLIGGEPAGVFLRVGERITGNLSAFLPVTTD